MRQAIQFFLTPYEVVYISPGLISGSLRCYMHAHAYIAYVLNCLQGRIKTGLLGLCKPARFKENENLLS